MVKKKVNVFSGAQIGKEAPQPLEKNVVNGHQMSQSITKNSKYPDFFIPVTDLQTSRLNFYCSSMMSALMNLKDKNYCFSFACFCFKLFKLCST